MKHLSNGGRRFDCCADIGYAAEDTHGNAEEAADWAALHHFKSLIIVTARYHMPRSLRNFHSLMPGVRLVPYPVEPEGVEHGRLVAASRTLHLLHNEYAEISGELRHDRGRPSQRRQQTRADIVTPLMTIIRSTLFLVYFALMTAVLAIAFLPASFCRARAPSGWPQLVAGELLGPASVCRHALRGPRRRSAERRVLVAVQAYEHVGHDGALSAAG